MQSISGPPMYTGLLCQQLKELFKKQNQPKTTQKTPQSETLSKKCTAVSEVEKIFLLRGSQAKRKMLSILLQMTGTGTASTTDLVCVARARLFGKGVSSLCSTQLCAPARPLPAWLESFLVKPAPRAGHTLLFRTVSFTNVHLANIY